MSRINVFSENQILEYIHCPTHYNAVYDRKVAGSEIETMPALLSQVAMAFFTNLMNGRVMRTSELKRKWDRICLEHQSFITEQKCLDGIGKLMQFYRWAERERLMVADVRVPYAIVQQRKGKVPVEIHGEIPVIAMSKDRQMEILVADFGQKVQDQSKLDMDIRYSMWCYAFQKERNQTVGVHIHNVKHDKESFAFRIKDDFLRLDTTLSNVSTAIEERLYYPRGNVLCSLCDMKDYCRAWH